MTCWLYQEATILGELIRRRSSTAMKTLKRKKVDRCECLNDILECVIVFAKLLFAVIVTCLDWISVRDRDSCVR